jgi:hypothetical protein
MSSVTGPPDPPNANPRLGRGGSRDDGDNSPPITQPPTPSKGISANSSSGIRTFRHRFKGGITCEVRINLDKIRNRQSGIQCYEWSRKPKLRVIPEYRRWMLEVYRQIADETGLKIMEAMQVKACLWELWSFEPRQLPRKSGELVTS